MISARVATATGGVILYDSAVRVAFYCRGRNGRFCCSRVYTISCPGEEPGPSVNPVPFFLYSHSRWGVPVGSAVGKEKEKKRFAVVLLFITYLAGGGEGDSMSESRVRELMRCLPDPALRFCFIS